MTTYLSLAVSDTMFSDTANLQKRPLTPLEVEAFLAKGVSSALNPSHSATIDVIHRKFGFELPVPEKAPLVALVPGDQLIVLQARLPRLNEGEIHSQKTVEEAPIKFSLWTVL